MLRKGRVDGSMEAIELRNGSCVVAADKRTPDGAAYASILVYCLSGKVLVRSGSEQLELSAREAVCEPLPDSMRLVAAGEAGIRGWLLSDYVINRKERPITCPQGSYRQMIGFLETL